MQKISSPRFSSPVSGQVGATDGAGQVGDRHASGIGAGGRGLEALRIDTGGGRDLAWSDQFPRPARTPMAQAEVSPLPTLHPSRGDEVPAALTAVYNWNYDSEIDTLRTLYANALERQWIALRDLDWSREIDREAFSNTFSMGGIPIQETGFWAGLDPTHALGDVAAHGRLHALELPARRAGRADGGGAARERRAPHGRQVLRGDADARRGPTRRGVCRLHPQARRGAADRAGAEAAARRRADVALLAERRPSACRS